MNKTELIDALAERLGDKKIAAAAVAGLVDVVVRTVNGGDKVTITGFGVFEKRARAARTARNPRTGDSVKVKKTNVPVFRPGTLFREVVSGVRTLPRASAGGPDTSPAVAERPHEVATAKVAIKAAKAAKAAAKAAKKESKAATKAPATKAPATKAPATKAPAKATAKAPTKATTKKAVKKSAAKK